MISYRPRFSFFNKQTTLIEPFTISFDQKPSYTWGKTCLGAEKKI